MRRRPAALAIALAAGGCGSHGPIHVSGTVFDFEGALGLLRQGQTAQQAHDASLVAGVTVYMDEDHGVRSLSTGADGGFDVPAVPWGKEMHPVASRFDYAVTEDGLGVQYAEGDVHDYPVAILSRGSLLGAIAAGFSTTVDQIERVGFQLFAIFDAPFPRGALVTDNVVVSASAGGTRFIAWDGAAQAYVTAPAVNQLPASAGWLGLFAVSGTDVPVRSVVADLVTGPGHPKVYVQHPMAIVRDRAMLFLLNPVN